jgi:hypothetical protein
MQIRQLLVANKTLFTLTQTFRYLNCCCNFFLYSATSSLFRRELREIFQCSNSLVNNQKDTNIDDKQRAKKLSSPTVNSANKTDQQHSSENRTLLSTNTAQTTIAIEENLNSIDSTNGHTVSFKT